MSSSLLKVGRKLAIIIVATLYCCENQVQNENSRTALNSENDGSNKNLSGQVSDSDQKNLPRCSVVQNDQTPPIAEVSIQNPSHTGTAHETATAPSPKVDSAGEVPTSTATDQTIANNTENYPVPPPTETEIQSNDLALTNSFLQCDFHCGQEGKWVADTDKPNKCNIGQFCPSPNPEDGFKCTPKPYPQKASTMCVDLTIGACIGPNRTAALRCTNNRGKVIVAYLKPCYDKSTKAECEDKNGVFYLGANCTKDSEQPGYDNYIPIR